jgi:hypothetical protein
MLEGAALLFSGQEEGNHARGDSLAKEDRSLAAQRFRQVAPATDEEFVSRIALRRLSTQVVSYHFFGVVVSAASTVNPKTLSMGTPSPEFRARVDDLITDLRHLIVENSTNESIDLSVAELRGSAEWDSKERYPSLTAFAREARIKAPFARAMSGQSIPVLFEHLLARTERTDRPLPKIYRRVWDNTYWWADAVCSRKCIENRFPGLFSFRPFRWRSLASGVSPTLRCDRCSG